MRAGIVDVGSNTMRLLVARVRKGGVDGVHVERVPLGLGEDVEQFGRISPEKLEAAEAAARSLVERARAQGAGRLEILVTSPGRQADNGEELRTALEIGSGLPVRILSADDEARLAYAGALAAWRRDAASVAVVDVGGGSAQLVVGTAAAGPVWARSVDIGSLRLTKRSLRSDPPDASELEAARIEVEAAFAAITPPLPLAALATGGTARALRKVVGRRRLDAGELKSAVQTLSRLTTDELVDEFGLAPGRARTVLAGALILVEAQRRLGLPLEVARGGIREGAALALLSERAAA
jgi:exopolyphosphatase / guanosine-5'-triphosphate,3'-diphosphate pyrophosphatase